VELLQNNPGEDFLAAVAFSKKFFFSVAVIVPSWATDC
jgi:hypothetical protein